MSTHGLLCLVLAAAGLSSCTVPVEGEACVELPEDGTCPAAEDVDLDEAFVYRSCDGEKILGVSGEAEQTGTGPLGSAVLCCYEAELLDSSPNRQCLLR